MVESEAENEDLYEDSIKNYTSPHFKRFFFDVYPEFEKFGTIKMLLVSKNISPHLRGNVYITYKNISESIECFKKMNGRYYAGLPLCVTYSFIQHLNDAKCIHENKCPRSLDCNFLHVYINPRVNICKRSRSPRKY